MANDFNQYAPYVEGVIPAFDSSKIIVPFEHNPVIPNSVLAGLRIQIRNLNSTTEVAAVDNSIPIKEPAEFQTPTDKLTVGQWYEIQMAYLFTDGQASAYSAKSVSKYIGMPSLEANENINEIKITYTDETLTEPVDTYELIAQTEAGTVIAATGLRTHDASLDIIKDGKRVANLEPWSIYSIPSDSKKITVICKLTTHNLYSVTKPCEYIVPEAVNQISNIQKIEVKNDMDIGAITVTVIPNKLSADQSYTAASYKLLRTEGEGFIWEEIALFSTSGGQEFNFSIPDWTVAHGTTYKYAVVQYNSNGVYSERLESEYITAEFEHMFLCDANRSLCVKFNPKVSSIKETILESKSDTIGGKYPFFFRNGDTRYKELPIQGLISYWMDEKEQFIKRSALGLASLDVIRPNTKAEEVVGNMPTTNLVGYNIAAERIMKLEVLEWLNNGQPKLFRSPTEGNYLIRLMNVSLSPEDKLSRMIHSFSATGYEIGEPSITGLKTEGIIDTKVEIPATMVLASQSTQPNTTTIIQPEGIIQRASFIGFMPGTQIIYGDDTYIIGSSGNLDLAIPANIIKTSSIGFVSYAYTPKGEPDAFNQIQRTRVVDYIDVLGNQSVRSGDITYVEFWAEGEGYVLNGIEYLLTDGFAHVPLNSTDLNLVPINDTTITVHYQVKESVVNE